MALPKQLKSARMTNDTLGINIDDKVGELESALCDIFGFTVNTDITESPLDCDNSGRITKALLRQKAASAVGIRYLETGGGKEYRIVNDGTYLSIDENTGSESSPVWTNRAKMAIATGVWTFTAIPVGPASNPTADNELSRKKYVDDEITALDGTVVHDTGAEAIAGVKTFGSFPVTPSSAPSADYEVANKKYVDDNGGVPAASQAEQEAGAESGKYVAPATQQFHPSAAKAWAYFQNNGTLLAGYNVSSITDVGTGDWKVNFTVSFSSVNYCAIPAIMSTGTGGPYVPSIKALTTSYVEVVCTNNVGALADPLANGIFVACFGDQ